MSKHKPFNFKTSEELLLKARELSVELPFQEDITPLLEPVSIGSKKVMNRLAVHPMEGFDSNPDGSPSELTFRRYKRYAEGGNGLIWFEATSVVREGRSNPMNLWLNRNNVDNYKRLVEFTRNSAHTRLGSSHDLFLVLQLTHAGRYSKPEGRPLPQAVKFNPYLDKDEKAIKILTDAELEKHSESFIEAAKLAFDAGFDSVDIKACHGYLINDLLSAYTREESNYGGEFVNRKRFLVDIIREIKLQLKELIPAVRLNSTDAIPYPYGFGIEDDGSVTINLDEPRKLIGELIELGCGLFNITAGISYYTPEVGRPFNRQVKEINMPNEHPLEGVTRLIGVAGELQKEFPSVPMVGTGYSWLNQFFPNVGAAVIANGLVSVIGLGRNAFAYPDAALDLIENGRLNIKKTCIACSRCTELMRAGRSTGCVIRDRDIYRTEYNNVFAGG
ncbi:hypothetical protein ACFLS9_06670 [Bacteroidota bacterium]